MSEAPKPKKYFRLSERHNEVRAASEANAISRINTGIAVLDEIMGFKKGYPVFIGGAPHSGKTEIGLEFMLNLSVRDNFKWFIYCGEGGSVDSVFLELLHKHLGKPFRAAGEKEKLQAEYFISEHFIIANDDLDYMISGFYDAVDEAEKELGIKFDGTCFDPFNDIEEELVKFGGREDKYLAYALKYVRKAAKKANRIDIIITHVADVRVIVTKDNQRYLPPALPTEWAGGRTVWRRGYLMVHIWRPPVFIADENGRNYEANETIVEVQKAKPKGIAILAKRSIYWDKEKNRYYCYQGGQILYPLETLENYRTPEIKEPKMSPAKDFTVPQNSRDGVIEETPLYNDDDDK